MSSELKSCPFCGSRMIWASERMHHVLRNKCLFSDAILQPDQVEAWNLRTFPHFATDEGRDNDALNSAVGVLRTQQAQPHRSTQHVLWEAIKDYAERANERTPNRRTDG